jgi:hypothetical protein
MMVKVLAYFGKCSASDCRLILQLGIALNKKLGEKHLPGIECQIVIYSHYFTDRVIVAYSHHYRKFA